MNKKLLSVILSATILAGSMVGCGKKTESSDAKNMTVGTWKTAQTIQPFFYDEFSDESENLEVKPFTNPGDMKTALLSGDLDFTGTTWVTAIMAASKGEPIKVVASMTEKCSALVVGKDSGINTTKDLKGKTIAYVPGTMHHILLLEVLNRAGLDPDKDVTLKKIDFFDMGQALASGSIDAFCSGEPYPSIAVEEGYGKILEYPYYDDSIGYINAAMITTEDEIKENPEKIQELVDKHVKASKHLMASKEEWINKAAEFGTEKKYLEKSTENIELSWDITPETVEQVKKLAERMKELGMIEKVPDIDAMFDLSFLENTKMKR
ncbi:MULTISPECIES: aliphatic sulfonate ABC transporter substrate-binding protein [Peptacetobacter]|uniref:ABC transporter substrate-binding protein n=1 Tax=Peptacetobacter TaxID=2743582 RepID=UPI002E79BF16|nr:aliphatic sulfonate ABC transporter substrate-binding protein [Peptacetobacter hiranonis]MEE0247843.1 aliphatic sulfonate ABC transporter substrate-binding protein [Peptacetobacter hiranonis]